MALQNCRPPTMREGALALACPRESQSLLFISAQTHVSSVSSHFLETEMQSALG